MAAPTPSTTRRVMSPSRQSEMSHERSRVRFRDSTRSRIFAAPIPDCGLKRRTQIFGWNAPPCGAKRTQIVWLVWS